MQVRFKFSLRARTFITSLVGAWQKLLSGDDNGLVQVWSIQHEQEQAQAQLHTRTIVSMQFVSDIALVLSTSSDGTACLFDAELVVKQRTFAHGRTVTSAVVYGDIMYTSCADGMLRKFPLLLQGDTDVEPMRAVKTHSSASERVVVGPSDWLLSIGDDGYLCVSDLDINVLCKHHMGSPGIACCSLQDGSFLIALFSRKLLHVNIASNGREIVFLRDVAELESGLLSLYRFENQLYAAMAPATQARGTVLSTSLGDIRCAVSFAIAALPSGRLVTSKYRRLDVINSAFFSLTLQNT